MRQLKSNSELPMVRFISSSMHSKFKYPYFAIIYNPIVSERRYESLDE